MSKFVAIISEKKIKKKSKNNFDPISSCAIMCLQFMIMEKW